MSRRCDDISIIFDFELLDVWHISEPSLVLSMVLVDVLVEIEPWKGDRFQVGWIAGLWLDDHLFLYLSSLIYSLHRVEEALSGVLNSFVKHLDGFLLLEFVFICLYFKAFPKYPFMRLPTLSYQSRGLYFEVEKLPVIYPISAFRPNYRSSSSVEPHFKFIIRLLVVIFFAPQTFLLSLCEVERFEF
jgi:hypothetical protein